MERKKKLLLGNQEKQGTEVGFQVSGEHWNHYLLDDGTVIRLKTVVTEIVRVDGEHDTEGNPVYIVKSQNVMAVSPPEELKKK